jgi:hypothetical protein
MSLALLAVMRRVTGILHLLHSPRMLSQCLAEVHQSGNLQADYQEQCRSLARPPSKRHPTLPTSARARGMQRGGLFKWNMSHRMQQLRVVKLAHQLSQLYLPLQGREGQEHARTARDRWKCRVLHVKQCHAKKSARACRLHRGKYGINQGLSQKGMHLPVNLWPPLHGRIRVAHLHLAAILTANQQLHNQRQKMRKATSPNRKLVQAISSPAQYHRTPQVSRHRAQADLEARTTSHRYRMRNSCLSLSSATTSAARLLAV